MVVMVAAMVVVAVVTGRAVVVWRQADGPDVMHSSQLVMTSATAFECDINTCRGPFACGVGPKGRENCDGNWEGGIGGRGGRLFFWQNGIKQSD
jgi:hypothetical protein